MALRTVVMGAATLWIAVFLALALMQGATRSSFFSAAFFVVLFTACSFFYNRLPGSDTRGSDSIWMSSPCLATLRGSSVCAV